MWDRFDIAEAWYLYLSHFHDGQWSEKYERLSQLTSWFKPGPMLKLGSLSQNGRRIYDDLVARGV